MFSPEQRHLSGAPSHPGPVAPTPFDNLYRSLGRSASQHTQTFLADNRYAIQRLHDDWLRGNALTSPGFRKNVPGPGQGWQIAQSGEGWQGKTPDSLKSPKRGNRLPLGTT